MGFPGKWRKWIWALLSGRAPVLVNGSPTSEFQCQRGLRQGDPLSPYLFILAMESLSQVIKKACESGLIRGLKCSYSDLILTYMMYVDDVVFLGDWSLSSRMNLKRLLRCFYLASGLGINLDKSFLFGIGVENSEVQSMAGVLMCNVGCFPFKHLGLIVGGNMNLARHWKPVIDTFKKRLPLWKARTLSFGGRITLLRLVLNALPTYFFSLFRAPVGIIQTLDRIRRQFLWGIDENSRKIYWVSWSKITASKDNGGVGLGCLADMNMVLLAKWWWRFKTKSGNLWRKVIWSFHSTSRFWNFTPCKMSISGPWKHICKISNYLKSVGLELHEIFHVAPGLNSELTFWFDSWVGFNPLYKMFPNLFMLEVSTMCLLKDSVSWINGDQYVQFHWTRQLRPVEHAEVNNLLLLVAFVVWVEGKDSWRSDVCDSGRFSVKALRSKIKRSSGEQQNASFIWSRWVPIKANFLAWRLWIGRLPSKDNLAKRTVQVISMECGVCSLEEESVEHLFGSCQLAVQIWEHVSKWCRVHPFFFFSAKDLSSLAQQLRGDVGWKQLVHLVILTSIWCIWKNMNNIVFNSTGRSVGIITEEIRAYIWIKSRSRYKTLTWEAWSNFNVFEFG